MEEKQGQIEREIRKLTGDKHFANVMRISPEHFSSIEDLTDNPDRLRSHLVEDMLLENPRFSRLLFAGNDVGVKYSINGKLVSRTLKGNTALGNYEVGREIYLMDFGTNDHSCFYPLEDNPELINDTEVTLESDGSKRIKIPYLGKETEIMVPRESKLIGLVANHNNINTDLYAGFLKNMWHNSIHFKNRGSLGSQSLDTYIAKDKFTNLNLEIIPEIRGSTPYFSIKYSKDDGRDLWNHKDSGNARGYYVARAGNLSEFLRSIYGQNGNPCELKINGEKIPKISSGGNAYSPTQEQSHEMLKNGITEIKATFSSHPLMWQYAQENFRDFNNKVRKYAGRERK